MVVADAQVSPHRRVVFLNSHRDFRQLGNFSIVVPRWVATDRVNGRLDQVPAALLGKRVRGRGRVERSGIGQDWERLQILVNNPADLVVQD
jgi:hypothetical protein